MRKRCWTGGGVAASIFGGVSLNPGMSDATEWPLNDGTSSHGMAATLTIKNGKGSFTVFRAKPLTSAEQEAAAKLVPAAAGVPAER